MQQQVEELSNDCVRSRNQSAEVNSLRQELDEARTKMEAVNVQRHQEIGQINRDHVEHIERFEHQLEGERNKHDAYKREIATEKEIELRETTQIKVKYLFSEAVSN